MGRWDPVIIALLALGGVLLLARLGNGVLWQDEAETAMLARRVLEFGYPRGTDGRNAIEIGPWGYGLGEAWVYNPWLSFYLLAGVFAVFGQSTTTARVPFALFAVLNLYLTWRLSRRLTAEVRVQRLSLALLVSSVPFLLHMRQCRYYAPTMTLVLGTCLGYLAFLERPSWRRALGLAALGTLLFHTNFGTFIPTAGALALHQVGWGGRAMRRRFVAVTALVGVLTLPWAWHFYRPAFLRHITLERLYHHLEYYVRITNKYLVPLAAVAGLSAVSWLAVKRPLAVPTWQRLSRSVKAFVLLLIAAHLGFLLVPDQRHMRYLIPMLPIFAIGVAMWAAALAARHRRMGWIVIALLLATNGLQSTRWRIPLADFIGELTHRYVGPMDGVTAYLRRHARPGDVAKIPYDDRTLMFYTDVTVEPPSAFMAESYPDWIIIRRDWIPARFFTSDYFRRIEAAYERIELDAPDVLWQNREDPGSHHFRTVQGVPRIVIYRKGT